MIAFRVYFADGHIVPVKAVDPQAAQIDAKKQHPGVAVTKVKRSRS